MTESVSPPSVVPPQTTDKPTEKPKPRWGVIVIWTAIVGLLVVLGFGLLNANAPRPEVGQPAPTFEMEFFDGYEWQSKSIADLEELQGKVVVLNFWASWCVECRVEADLLEQASRMYRDDVVFLGIAYVDVEPESLKYLEEFDVTYPNAPDLGTRISRDYEITGVPETFIIDRQGTIADVVIGPVSERRLFGMLDQLVAQEG